MLKKHCIVIAHAFAVEVDKVVVVVGTVAAGVSIATRVSIATGVRVVVVADTAAIASITAAEGRVAAMVVGSNDSDMMAVGRIP